MHRILRRAYTFKVLRPDEVYLDLHFFKANLRLDNGVSDNSWKVRIVYDNLEFNLNVVDSCDRIQNVERRADGGKDNQQ